VENNCRLHGSMCSGPVISILDINLCTYHGELAVKLKSLSLNQLENIVRTYHRKDNKPLPLYIEEARRFALCSSVESFKKNIASVYTNTYDYRNHK